MHIRKSYFHIVCLHIQTTPISMINETNILPSNSMSNKTDILPSNTSYILRLENTSYILRLENTTTVPYIDTKSVNMMYYLLGVFLITLIFLFICVIGIKYISIKRKKCRKYKTLKTLIKLNPVYCPTTMT